MERKVVIQKLQKNLSPTTKRIVYYTIISTLNSLRLTEREIQLLAYTNMRGSISAITAKNQFCSLYNTSIPTVNNLISKLKKKQLLVKSAGRICVNEKINIDLRNQTVLNINLTDVPEEAA